MFWLTKGSFQMLKIAVCDDNKDFLHYAVNLIEKWSQQSRISVEISACNNGDELIALNNSEKMDIIFLDIIMPLLSGMETARELRLNNTAVKIVFLTSSVDFALESYEVKASGYLLKPVSFEKISEILNECAEFLETEPENIVVKTCEGYQKLYFYDIEYIEAQNKKVIFYLKSKRNVMAIVPFHTIEEMLAGKTGFFKCHRSYLVYMLNIESFNNAKIITKSGRNIPIARGCSKTFKDAYFEFMFL